MSTKSRIALVDDHPTLLRGIEGLLNEDGRYEVVGSGSRADDIGELANRLTPDIMIVDLSMPGDVLAAIESVTRAGTSKVVVFTAYGDVDLAMNALDAGAQGFVLKGRPSRSSRRRSSATRSQCSRSWRSRCRDSGC